MRILVTLLALVFTAAPGACGDPKSGALGSYRLDQEAHAATMRELREQRRKDIESDETMDDAARAEAMASLDDLLLETEVTFVLKDDDSFLLTVRRGDDRRESRGSYVLDGNKIILTRTHVDGEPRENDEAIDTISGTIDDGVIELVNPNDSKTVRLRK